MISEDLESLLTLLNSAGVVTTLVTMLYLVLSGKLIPRNSLDEIIAAVVRKVLDELH